MESENRTRTKTLEQVWGSSNCELVRGWVTRRRKDRTEDSSLPLPYLSRDWKNSEKENWDRERKNESEREGSSLSSWCSFHVILWWWNDGWMSETHSLTFFLSLSHPGSTTRVTQTSWVARRMWLRWRAAKALNEEKEERERGGRKRERRGKKGKERMKNGSWSRTRIE